MRSPRLTEEEVKTYPALYSSSCLQAMLEHPFRLKFGPVEVWKLSDLNVAEELNLSAKSATRAPSTVFFTRKLSLL